MKTRWLLMRLTFIWLVLLWVGTASALTINFLEPLGPTGNIRVERDPDIGVIVTSHESASLSIGNVTTAPLGTVIAKIGFTNSGSMQAEGSGIGVSDILTLIVFSRPIAGAPPLPIGFQALFQSDPDSTERGLPTPGDLTNLIEETGALQVAFTGSVAGVEVLTVRVRSDRDVPEPASLLLLGAGLAGLVGIAWRRHRT